MIRRLGLAVGAVGAAIAAAIAAAAVAVRSRGRAGWARRPNRGRGTQDVSGAPQASPGAIRAPDVSSGAVAAVPVAAVPVAAVDELRGIMGIGPALADRLRESGVTTIEQIAAWTPEEAHEMAARIRVSPDRIAREDWVGQAKALRQEGAR